MTVFEHIKNGKIDILPFFLPWSIGLNKTRTGVQRSMGQCR